MYSTREKFDYLEKKSMNRIKRSYVPEPTLQASARATESTFQAAHRTTYFVESQETVKEYSKALGTDLTTDSANLEQSEYLSPDIHDSDLQANLPEKNLRNSVYTDKFKEDLKYWNRTSSKTLKRIRRLMEEIMRDPFKGIGKPEPLKYQGSDMWSRRIDEEHRIVYLISADQIDFLQARYHYEP